MRNEGIGDENARALELPVLSIANLAMCKTAVAVKLGGRECGGDQ